MLNNRDESLFDDIILPMQIEKVALIKRILSKCNDYESLYGDPYFLQAMIEDWFSYMYPTFDKWIEVLEKTYDPLSNYNLSEIVNENDKGDGKELLSSVRGESTTNQASGKDSSKHLANSNGDSTNTVSAFDSNTYEPNNKNVWNDNLTKDDTDLTYGRKDTTRDDETYNRTKTNEYKDEHHLGRKKEGNIGIRSNQELLEQELKIRYFNIYEAIADMFIGEFVILVDY